MAERLFSAEFAELGVVTPATPTAPPQRPFMVQQSIPTPSSGEFGNPDTVAGAGTAMSLERRRPYITYSASVLQVLADPSATMLEERNLFKVVSRNVGKPDFHQFRLALGVLGSEGLIAAAGTNEFGDPMYRITDQGAAVAPPKSA